MSHESDARARKVAKLSADEREVMVYALNYPECDRNHFCACPESNAEDYDLLKTLSTRGLVSVAYEPTEDHSDPLGGMTVFAVTAEGLEALKARTNPDAEVLEALVEDVEPILSGERDNREEQS